EPSREGGEQPDALTVATIHAAKGLEWRCVWVAGAAEGVLPHRKAVESGAEGAVSEERRVAYVALTRAMDELVVSAATRIEGRDDHAAVSRFVAEAGLSVPREKAA
ncbi:MAG: 3'-5' exonuclease, partial [Dehalococcoidia bacterium]